MIQEEEKTVWQPAAGIQNTIPVFTILVCAGLSLLFLNTGLLSLFFLAPIGYAVLVSGTIWIPFAAAAAVNIIIYLINQYISDGRYVYFFLKEPVSEEISAGITMNGANNMWMEIFYFTVLYLGFVWIIGNVKFVQIRTLYRFIFASAAGCIAFLLFIVGGNQSDSGFNIMVRNMAEFVTSVIISASQSDAVRHSTLQQLLTPQRVLEVTRSVVFRGGALLSIILLLFLNRQMSFSIFWLIKKQRKNPGLSVFYAPPYTIWVLSCSLALILLSSLFKVEILGIAAWNVFVICVIIFLAQGTGILAFLLKRRSPSFRLAANVLIVIAILSPGLNTLAIVALFLLGIIEIWRPIRAQISAVRADE